MPRHLARWTFASIGASIALLLLASPGLAWELELRQTAGGPPTIGGTAPGELLVFDLLLSTDALGTDTYADYPVALSAGVTFDPVLLNYRPDLSDSNDYYPLYTPTSGCKGCARWHVPLDDPPAVSPGAPLPFLDMVTIASVANELGVPDPGPGLQPSYDDEWLATVAFEQVNVGDWGGSFSLRLDVDGTGWRNGAGEDISDQITTSIVFLPEPSTLLLFSSGLALLAAKVRRRPL